MAAGTPPDEPPFDYAVPEEIIPPEFADFMTPEGAVGAGLLEKESGIPLSKPGLRGRMPGAPAPTPPAPPQGAPRFSLDSQGPTDVDLRSYMRAYDTASGAVKSPEQQAADVLLGKEDPAKEFKDPAITFLEAVGLGDTEFVRTLKVARQQQVAHNRANTRDINTQIDHVKTSALIAASVAASAHPAVAGARLPVRIAIQGGIGGAVSTAGEAISPSGQGGAGIAADAAVTGAVEGLLSGTGAAGYARRGAVTAAAAARSQGRFARFALPSAQDAVNTAQELGLRLMPDKLVNHWLTGAAGGLARTSITGSGHIARHELRVSNVARDAFDATLNQLPNLPREQVMDMLGGIIRGHTSHVKGVARAGFRAGDEALAVRYRTVTDRVTENIDTGLVGEGGQPLIREATRNVERQVITNGVNITSIQDGVNEVLRTTRGGEAGGTRQLPSGIRAILDLPDVVSYEQAHNLRSDLSDLSDHPALLRSAATSRLDADITMLSERLTTQIDVAIGRAPAEIQRVLREAQALWRDEVKGVLSERFVRKLATSQPEDVVDTMLIGGNAVGHWRDVRTILERVEGVEGPAQQALQGVFMRRVLDKSSTKELINGRLVPRVNGAQFVEQMGKLTGQDDALLQEVFPGNNRTIANNLTNYANVLKHNESAAKSGGKFTIAFTFAQATAASTLFHFSGVGAAGSIGAGTAAVTLGPMALARFLTGPGSRWLAIGAQAAPHAAASRPAWRLLARGTLVGLGDLVANDLLSPEETEKAQVILQDAQRTLGLDPVGVPVGGKAPISRLSQAELDSVRKGSITTVDALKDAVHRKTGGQ